MLKDLNLPKMKKKLLIQIPWVLLILLSSIMPTHRCNAQEISTKKTNEHIELDIEQLRKIVAQDTANMIIIPRVYDKPMIPGDPISFKLDLRGISQPDVINFGQPAIQLMQGMPIYGHGHGIELPGIGGYNAIGVALITYLNNKTRLINSSEAISYFNGPSHLSPIHNLSIYSAMEYDVDEYLTLSTYGRYIVDDNKISRKIRPAFSPQNIIGGAAKFKINDNVKIKVGVEVRQY